MMKGNNQVFRSQLFVIFLLVISIIFILTGCKNVKLPVYLNPGPNPAPTYKFDYKPSENLQKVKEPYAFLLLGTRNDLQQPYSKGELTIKIGNIFLPRLSTESANDMNQIINSFKYALKEDFKELLTARGFRLIGEGENQDIITFNQRETSNFSMQPVIRIELDDTVDSTTSPNQPKFFGDWEPGEVKGKLIVKARVSLEVKEPLTWQLLWTKSVESQAYSEDYSFKWNYGQNGLGYVVGQDTRPQVLANIMSKLYLDVMNKFETYIDPNEFSLINKQAQEIRKKAQQVIK